jgi:small-conductance mechanosensitive channel
VARHLIETAVVAAAAVVVSYTVAWLITRRVDDEYGRRSIRRAIHFLTLVVALVVVGYVWGVFSRRTSWAFALLAAGLAFALQEVLGSIAGWFNIMLGGIYRIGDRIELAGVHGDVIDITPLRTKVLEIGGGGSSSTDLWVHGRQATGRIVAISNKTTFDEPAFNYSALFEYVFHEVTFPIGHDADWRRAEEIIRDAAIEVSRTKEARQAVDEMRRHYPIPIADLEPRVFVRATDNYLELSARFVIEVRTSRVATDELTRIVHDELAAAGIPIASATMDLTITAGGERTSRESSRSE